MRPSGAPAGPASRRGLLALAVAHGLSALSDGVYLVALPWLALEVTGSTAVLGLVLAIEAIPRALFMAIGGAWADRLSARFTLAASSGVSAAIVAAIAGLAAAEALPVAGLYVGAAVLGVVDGVAFPAASALVPRLVAADRLHRANALLSVLTQGALFGGPALAAALLAWGGASAALVASAVLSAGAAGVVLAIPRPAPAGVSDVRPSLLADLREGLGVVHRRPSLGAVVVLLAGLNLALVGPVLVGGALLAETRLGGSGAFGALISAWGAGGLAGALSAARASPARPLRGFLLACVAMAGGVALLAAPLGLAGAAAVAAGLGVLDGWLEVHATTWIQRQTPLDAQGRVMGLVALAAVGVEPVSYAVAGAVTTVGIVPLFLGAGGLLLAVTAGVALALRRLR